MSPRPLLRCSVLGAAALVAGCEPYYDDDSYYGRSANEIVFGIGQRVDPASGKTEVRASYSYLGLANKGGSNEAYFRDGDGEGACYFERYDGRLGPLQVESGVATWTGGKLPAVGLQVLANQREPARFEGEGWTVGDTLTFDVTGFAMPELETVSLSAPSLDLGTITITPAAAEGAREIAIETTDDVTVTWTPPSDPPRAHVMVTLDTEEENSAGGGVRCFGSAKSGSAVIPAKWVARLFSSVPADQPIKGRVAVSSHRQVTYYARRSWTAYIVATTQHEARAFTGTR